MKIYMARKGDNLRSLAEKFHVHPDVLFEVNPHIANPQYLDAGVKVRVPIAPAALEMFELETMHQHKVKQGDTLWKLSKAWDIPLKELISVNQHLRNPNVLLEGEIVYIPRMEKGMSVKQSKAEAKHEHGDFTNSSYSNQSFLSQAFTGQTSTGQTFPGETFPSETFLSQTFPSETFPSQTFPNETFPIQSERPEIAHTSPFAGTPEAEQMYWGELYPSYTTSAINPYDSYTIDPRQNIPAYPMYEGIQEEESDEQPVRQPTSRNKQAKRTKAKKRQSLKVPSKRKGTGRSGNKRKTSKPWTTI